MKLMSATGAQRPIHKAARAAGDDPAPFWQEQALRSAQQPHLTPLIAGVMWGRERVSEDHCMPSLQPGMPETFPCASVLS